MAYMPFSFLRPRNDADEMMSPYRKIVFDALPPNSDQQLSSPKKDLTSVYGQISGLEDTPELVAYKEHLMKMPTRDTVKPNRFTKIVGALSGAVEGYKGGPVAGAQAAQSIVRTPYARAREEWGSKAENLGTLANISRQTMSDRVSLYRANQQAQLAADKFELDRKNIESQVASRAVTAEEARIRTEKLRAEAVTAGYKEVKDNSTGIAKLVHPVTGHELTLGRFDESADDKRSKDSRVRWNLFQQEEGLRQNNRVALEDVQFNKSKQLEGIRQEDRLKLQDVQAKANLNRDLARANAANSRSGANLLNQNRAAAQSIINSDPANFEGMGITIDKGNISVDQENLDLSTPEKLAKYVALMNTMYKGVEGAAKLTMPEGFDEFGNRKRKFEVKR
jgi:hypothetical protein